MWACAGRRNTAAAVVAGTILLGGCSGTSSDHAEQSGGRGTTTSASTRPVRVRDYPLLRVGRTGTVRSPKQHAALRVTVARPTISATRLAASYGYPPARGRYVTFRVTVVNAGAAPVDLSRLDFYVRTPTLARTTTDDGNAPYSGSPHQLDSTELAAGQRVSNELTFDVRRPTGVLFYAPGGSRALGWRF